MVHGHTDQACVQLHVSFVVLVCEIKFFHLSVNDELSMATLLVVQFASPAPPFPFHLRCLRGRGGTGGEVAIPRGDQTM